MGAERRNVTTRGQGLVLNGYSISTWDDERFWRWMVVMVT